MNCNLLALSFSLLPWKEARKVAVWEQYCCNKSPKLSAGEARELEALSKEMARLQDEAEKLGAKLVLPDTYGAAHLQEWLPYPVALWVKGSLPPSETCLAVVGSRTPSIAGRNRAYQLAKGLENSGIAVISGLALGIDTAAHLGALEKGQTWGVLGCGLKNPYPPQNISLMDRIVESGGGVLTCFPPDAKPLKWHFPRRNLLMVAWTKGVVVVEARAKSGSLITAKLALDLGKDLWAIPGPPESIQSEGTNALLREGAARFARGANDVLEDMVSFF